MVMKVVFRVDSSYTIGNGHVMRCLALATELKAKGHRCSFITRSFYGHINHLVSEAGFDVFALPDIPNLALPKSSERTTEDYWKLDFEQSLAIIKPINPDWLVLDHYSLGIEWEVSVKPFCRKLLVIEDLTTRKHDCDILLNQNLGAEQATYRDLINQDALLLLGLRFALLRSEFRAPKQIDDQRNSQRLNVLINLGGTDPDGLTSELLDSLCTYDFRIDIAVTALVNPHSKSYATIAKQLSGQRYAFPVSLLPFCSNMQKLYDQMDFAIGAAGSSTWERAARGLPSALVVLAENQVAVAKAAEAVGIAVVILDTVNKTPLACEQLNHILTSPDELSSMKENTQSLVDGLGTRRVTQVMRNVLTKDLCLTPAKPSHCRVLYKWQKEPGARKFFYNPTIPTWKTHSLWFKRTVNDDKKILYIIKLFNSPAGYVRIDLINKREAEISILVSRPYRGLGIAARALFLCLEKHPSTTFKANIKPGNYASKRTFLHAGFIPYGTHAYVKKHA